MPRSVPIIFCLFILLASTAKAQDFLPKLDQLKSIQPDSNSVYFKEIWILSRDVNKNDAGGFLRRATEKMDLGYFKEALPDIDKSITIDSTLSYSYFLKGFILFRNGSHSESLLNFKKAIALNDTNAFSYFYSAELFMMSGKFNEADSLYNRAIKIDNKLFQAYFGLANLSLYRRETVKAEKLYNKVIKLRPDFPLTYLNLALLNFFDHFKAIKYINKAIEVSPSYAHAYFMRGYLEIFQDKIFATFKDWNKAIELDSLNIYYRISRGFLYIQNKQNQEGFLDLAKALKTSNADNYVSDFQQTEKEQITTDFFSQIVTYNAWSNELTGTDKSKLIDAICLFLQEKYDLAEDIYSKLSENSSSKGLVLYLRGYNLEHFHKPDLALTCYKNAIREKSFPTEAYLRQGIVMMDLRSFYDAIKSLTIYINGNDSTKLAFRARANSFLQISKFDSAIIDYTSYLKLDSSQKDILTNRAFCFKQLEKYEEAIQDYDRILNHNPDIDIVDLSSECKFASGDTTGAYKLLNDTYKNLHFLSETGYNLLGTINLLNKNYDSAIVVFTELIKINPQNINGLIYRGLAFYSKQEYVKAKSDLTAALKINNEEITALYTRGLVYVKLNDQEDAFTDLQKAASLGHPLAKRAISIYLRDYRPKLKS
jgi:tetratricopeptide (TPR) repeat protein